MVLSLPGRVDVQSAEVSAELQRFFNGEGSKVLVSEGDDLLLRHQQRQLVFALVVQLGELDARDFGADRRSDVLDMNALLQQVGEGRVGVFSVLVVLKWLEGRVSKDKSVGVSVGIAFVSHKYSVLTQASPLHYRRGRSILGFRLT